MLILLQLFFLHFQIFVRRCVGGQGIFISLGQVVIANGIGCRLRRLLEWAFLLAALIWKLNFSFESKVLSFKQCFL